jgi:hypothetical protein
MKESWLEVEEACSDVSLMLRAQGSLEISAM